ncbi:sporulation protein YtxC [Halalkalibacillus halophilus]|uniref:sporulation protein YtxC n=1 Tax=Halalkalibacillus halophilus TaxID=392827 RepID=UPI0003F9A927|nr:sporulation protein YtxC [Halalkalibacillus halophilus]
MDKIVFLVKDQQQARALIPYIHKHEVVRSGLYLYVNAGESLQLINQIYQYVIQQWVPNQARKIFTDTYYYDQAEMEDLLPYVKEVISSAKQLHSSITETLYERVVYYSRVLSSDGMLSLRKLEERLFDYWDAWPEIIGFAIESYQGEATFQATMDDARKFIQAQPFYYKEVHVFLENDYSIYNENGQKITEEELDRLPVPLTSYPTQSTLLQDLIKLKPESVVIHTSESFSHELHAIWSIFEERTKIIYKTS